MAGITHILAANIPRQFVFVMATLLGSKFSTNLLFAASKCTSQYNDSGSSTCSRWLNDRMVAVVKHFWLLV